MQMSKARNIADLGTNDVLETSSTGISVTGKTSTETLSLGSVDVLSSASELNTLDGITATTTELNFLSGVTSAIQTQLNSKLGSSGGSLTGNLSFADGAKAVFGDDDDLEIYHNSGANAFYFRNDLVMANLVGSANLTFAGNVIALNPFQNVNFGSSGVSIDAVSNRLTLDIGANSSARIATRDFSNNTQHYFEVRSSSQTQPIGVYRNRSFGTVTNIQFDNELYGVRGSITTNTSRTYYNTTSDERMKENIADATDTVSIDDIRVRKFDWKVNGEHERLSFVAQELYEVYPEAVSVPPTEEGVWGVDASKLVPLLVKELQELKARVAELENN
jgi:hypothetical protein